MLGNDGFVPRRPDVGTPIPLPPSDTTTTLEEDPSSHPVATVSQSSTSTSSEIVTTEDTIDHIQINIEFSGAKTLSHCPLLYFSAVACLTYFSQPTIANYTPVLHTTTTTITAALYKPTYVR